MTTHLAEHLSRRRQEKGLSAAQLAKLLGYMNVARGIRRIETFEKTGDIHPTVLAKLAAALDVDRTTMNRLAYADYRDWFAAISKPIVPRVGRRILFGGGLRRLPKHVRSVAEMEQYAAEFARKCKMDVCLILNRRIKVWFSSDGSFKETIEEVPGEQ